jgi:maleylacetoacetate isomerase
MKLYTYWRSTSSYRVRIALALKGFDVEQVFVHLARNGGQQHEPAFRVLNPQGRLPVLELGTDAVITQSPAILEYLEEIRPTPPLLPSDPVQRARVRAVAAIIGCDIHPLHNIGPLNYLRKTLDVPEPEVSKWIATWIGQGLAAVEALIGDRGFCFGPDPGLADVYLVPQVYAAQRFGVTLEDFPRIGRVERLALDHVCFRVAHPSRQPDAE